MMMYLWMAVRDDLLRTLTQIIWYVEKAFLIRKLISQQVQLVHKTGLSDSTHGGVVLSPISTAILEESK